MRRRPALILFAIALLAGCASEPSQPPTKEMVYAVTASNQLIRFNAGQPQKLLSRKALTGLLAQDRLVGIDYRVARGQLYGLGASGQLYRIDPVAAAATTVGSPAVLTGEARDYGFDFNPTVDRIRVIGDTGLNLRMHPDTGAMVDSDPAKPGLQLDGTPAYDAKDSNAGKKAAVVAAGYTYNKQNDKLTTNYVIERNAGVLATMGTHEDVTPAVSPNTGRLYTVGPLGLPPFERATLDISDLSNAAYAAITPYAEKGSPAVSRWYRIDLKTGKAQLMGTIGEGEQVVGAAIEP
ncbi:DUF4394 domain-containing protein [Pelomonas sp. SE-A7]|uniref:DUF4394 domain-containing protein n=1 Tax=Pelomonas sp. SE-A7 TaxID=3054953 RepID=UPI00259D25EF|nr:DUF4394 domain-containing protein [Pelomonas sp. SE-A7]MDM4766353.1 DUF4394 domain-containing protein [Pelomonas sp. SE-A7]